ncbi:fasciclin domain-containing protein [Chitinophaga sp. RAB17]|uniref:fasciclin domain-containing protein n=1 Tax=Chitinophaga sp. RAB17 TaxID=3233049 RepID=UPI003F936F8E
MILWMVILILAAGCIKSSDSLIQPSASLKSERGNLTKAIAGIDSLSLFFQALNKSGYAAMLETNNMYTLFAPGNAAMQLAGLNADKIGQLSPDSLRKIVSYHILAGAYDEQAFESLMVSLFLPTLKNDTVLVPQQKFIIKTSWLSIQKGDQLYVNSYAVAGNTPPVTTANGFIYPIGKVIVKPPVDESRTMWDVVETDPELSMYRDAVILLDSIKRSDAYFDGTLFFDFLSPPLDQPLLSARKTNPVDGTIYQKTTPALLAPTNKAFHDAGFHSIDDLRTLAYRYPFGVTARINDDYTEIMFDYRFSSLDTLLGRNILESITGDYESKYPVRILYADMLKGKINNGIFNKMVRGTAVVLFPYMKYPYDLQFSGSNGIAYVQWSSHQEKIMIPLDADPWKPVNNYNLDNGVIYKVDKLFYPFN